MITPRIRTIVIVAAILVVGASLLLADLRPGTKAPNFTLPTIDGKSFTLSKCFAGSGKVVLLDIWATWCPPCRDEVPVLVDLQRKMKGKDVVIIGVSVDRNKADVVDFAKKEKINYTIAHDPGAAKLGEAYRVRGIPATYIIDRKGTIRYAHSGFPRDEESKKQKAVEFERQINTLLAEK